MKTKRLPTMSVWFEPVIDARVRRHCAERKISINEFVRESIRDLCNDRSVDRTNVPTHSETYGRLSHQCVTVRLTKQERKELQVLAERLSIHRNRSYSRLIRFAVSLACVKISSSAG